MLKTIPKNSRFDLGMRALWSPLLLGVLALSISGCSVQFKNNPAALAAAASRFPVMGMLILDSLTPGPIGASLAPVIAGHATVPVLFIKLYSDPGCTSLVSAGNELNFQSGMGFAVLANTTTTIYARGLALDGSNATDCTVMATYTNDTTAPVVTIVTPATAGYVTAANQSALIFSGACSENGRPVTVAGSYSGSTTCTTGAYSFALDVSTLPDGALSFQAGQTDLAGNSGQSAVVNLVKATNTPTVAITAPNSGAFASIGNVSAFAISGSCSENGQAITLSGAASGSALCAAGVWSTTLDLSAAAQGAFTIRADHVSAASVSALQNSRSFTKDTVAPTVAITSPAAASYINSVSAGAFTLSGTCSENTRTVSISGAATATATCTTGSWSAVLDLSLVADGAVTLRADLSDLAGNTATQSTRAFTKVSNPGGADSLSIAAGAAYTNSSTVALTLSSTNYQSQMYVTNTAGCASGGAWEAYATSKAGWTLGQSNATATVYAKFQDAAGNVSACTSDTIIHDNTVPTLSITSPAAASFVNSASVASFTLSGTCSEGGRTIAFGGAASGSTTCGSGTWSTSLDLSSAPSGSVSITADLTDAAGNSAVQATRSFTKDVTAPTVAITSPAAGSALNAAGMAAFTLSGTCSENGQSVSVTGAASATVTCAAGAFTHDFDLTALAEGSFSFYADHSDAAGNTAAQSSRSFTKDSVAPTVAITSPAAASFINSATAGVFTISGTCSENTRTVSVSGAATATATCTTGAWSSVLDLSLVADGAVTLRADLTDAAGNSATQSTRSFTKVSNPGGPDTITIAAGAAYTNSSSVALTLSSTNYQSQMYVTNTAGCALGGAWEAYATSKAGWTLGQSNATATVYVKFQDAAGNVSACASDTIIHDSIVPTVAITSPVAASYVNAASVAAFNVSGTCSEVGRTVTIAGTATTTATCSGGNTWSANLDLSAASQGAVSVTADLSDAAGNNAVQSTRAFTKDTTAPTVAITSPASGSSTNAAGMATFTLSGTCSENGQNVVLSGAASATVACAGGTFSQAFDLTALSEGAFTFNANHSDAAGNAATQSSRSFTKDSVAPTVAITSPAAASYINSATAGAFVLSGTCSENTQAVSISGAATATATCTTGAWSTSLDLSLVADGAVTLRADLADAAGNSATQSTRAFTKASNPGGADSISIAAGAAYTNSSTVALTLSSANYTSQMYITNTAGCASGGAWEAYATSKAGWSLGQSNATATVYVKFQDVAGNISACINDTIIHDNIVPTVAITSPAASSYVNAASVSAFAVSGTCSEAGRTVTIAGTASSTATCSGGNTWSATLDLSAAAQGAVSVTADLTDAAGNTAVQSTRAFTKDTSLPTVAITSPASGSYVVSSGMATFTVSGTCSENGQNVVLSGAASATVACAAGAFSQSFDLSALGEGAFTFNANHADAAGNPATQSSRSFTKDTVAPTVAITTPAGGAYVNSANVASVTVSGTCSENGRNVVFTGAASGSTTCATGAFSTTLDFSAAAQGTLTLYADHTDAAGNPATQAAVALTKDTVAPTLSISAPSSGTVANSSGSFTYTVTVSGSSSVNLAAGNVSLNTTGGATCSKAVTNGTTTSVTVTLSSCSGVAGTVGITIAAGVAQDTAGNSSAATGPSGTATVVTTAFTQSWPFDFATTASYTYDTTKMDFTGGVCRLTGTDQVDDDNTSSGFAGGSFTGTAWDGANSIVRVDPTTAYTCNSSLICSELDSSWTPQWANLVTYWNLNEAAGTSGAGSVKDVKSVNNGTPTNITLGVAGKMRTGASFNGTSSAIDTGTGLNFTTQNFSFSFWLKLNSFTTDVVNQGPVIFYRGQFQVYGYYAGVAADGSIAFVTNQSGAVQVSSTGPGAIATGKWFHIGIVRSGSSVRIYVNGQDVTSTAGSHVNPASAGAVTFLLGTYNNYIHMNGILDEFGVWSSALSAAEIQTIYTRQMVEMNGSKVGVFTSRIFDALSTGSSWTKLGWVPTLPFTKELSATNELQTNYTSLVGAAGTSADSALATNLVGLWHMNESSWNGTSGEVIDSTGNSNHGQSYGSASTISEGVLNRAANLSAANPYVSIPNSATIGALSQLTLSAWVKLYTYPAATYNYLAARKANSSAGQRFFTIGSTGGVGTEIQTVNNGWYSAGTSTGSTSLMVPGKWYLLTVTYDGSRVRFYFNGKLEGTGTSNISGATQGVQPLVLGSTDGSANISAFNGAIDEVGMWSRALDGNEIQQLYRRGANRVKFQVRNCTTANAGLTDCTDDSAGANWKGPDGTNQTYFSELMNMSTQSATPSGTVNTTLPSMLFSNFTSPVGTSRYFQYRTVLESDDTSTNCNYGSGATWCSPELKSVTVDPVHYDTSSPTVVGHTGVSYYSLASLAETLGASCASGIGYNLGVGAAYSSATWYWWDAAANAGSGGWVAADGTAAKSNPAATITTNASAFGSTVGTGTVYFKAYLKSSGTSKCELDNLTLTGQQ
jgi:hypothetical protein